MCSSNCANPHAHFPLPGGGTCRFYLSGHEFWSDTGYYPFKVQTQCKRFNQDCSEVCLSLQASCSSGRPPPPSPPRLMRLQRLPLPLWWRQILLSPSEVQMRFVQWSIKFGRAVFVHLEAAGTCNLMQTNKRSQQASWKATMQQNR